MNVELVSGSYFRTLGVAPTLGRVLTDGDDRTPGSHPVAVASYSWWQRRFGRNPQAVGAPITIGSTVYTIVGVAPPSFFGVTVGQSPDLWIPLSMEKEISPGWNGLGQNLFQSLYLIARLQPGVSQDGASAQTNLLFKRILRGYVGPKPSPKDLANIEHAQIELTSAVTGLSQIRLQFASPLKVLMAVVVLVLLIACANVANLLLAWGAMAFSQLQPIPIRVIPDAEVLGFTLLAALLTVFLFGTAPALYATRLSLALALKEGRGVLGTTAHHRFSSALVIGQVALSLLLLVGAGLFLQSLRNLLHVDTGFDQ